MRGNEGGVSEQVCGWEGQVKGGVSGGWRKECISSWDDHVTNTSCSLMILYFPVLSFPYLLTP